MVRNVPGQTWLPFDASGQQQREHIASAGLAGSALEKDIGEDDDHVAARLRNTNVL